MRIALPAAVLALVLPFSPPPAISVAVAARSIQPGELVVLTMTTTGPADTLKVRAFDREALPFAAGARTWRVLVGIDLDVAPGTYPVAIVAESAGAPAVRATYNLIVRAKAYPTRRLTVDEAFVNPPPEALVRIQQDTRDLNQVWASSVATRIWTGAFVRPVPDPSNSAFGTRSVFNGVARSPHGGADFLSPAGRPVEAPNAGRIALARDLYYTGNTVVIDHGLGLFSLFAHLSVINVHDGDAVKAGQVVGAVGATGRVTGAHLHWTVRAAGARVDPLSLLALLGK
jgi:murein DD-endopeptidase MepM/ murein hydrolase activator NlpD